MSATVAMKMRPWTTPNYATIDLPPRPRQDGAVSNPSISIKDLPVETLDALAKQWLVELYAKAGKPMPEERT